MPIFSRVLVDVESAAPGQPALQQAYALAARCGAEITVADPPPAPAGARRAKAIAEQVDKIGAGVVIRSHARDLDQALLRKCRSAVWIVGPDSVATPSRIVAAVNAIADGAEERELNAAILDAALTLRELWPGRLVVMSAWLPFAEDLLRSHMAPEQFREFQHQSYQEVERGLAALVDAAGARAASVETMVIHGAPHEAIVYCAEAERADLIVMGTSVGHGLAEKVLGHNAERVLKATRTSVLAVKPPRFTR